MLWNMVRRLDGIIAWLVPVPMADTSNGIPTFNRPDDPFNMVFWLCRLHHVVRV